MTDNRERTIRDALACATARLRAASDSPGLDASLLLAQVLGKPRSHLIAHGDDALSAADAAAFDELVARRRGGEPVAYLTGSKGFWSLDLAVTPAVLVPRPETELLVELALARLPPEAGPRAADLGTGSGAIALALASERPRLAVVATDAHPAALAVARSNAARLQLGNVEFREGDWFGAFAAGERFDLLVSNPPYVAAGDPHLAALGHEPRAALAAGEDGLDALRRIAAGAPAHLLPGGHLLLEHGAEQGAAVRKLFQDAGFEDIETHPDLAGHDRVTTARQER